MSRTSPGKTGSKRKRSDLPNNKGRALAASKARPAKNKALRAKTDSVLTQELQDSPGRNEVRSNGHTHPWPGVELLDLMSRAVSASLILPIRMARCRTPVEVWSQQNQFLQGIASDYQSVAFRMMSAAFNALPELAPVAQNKKRKRAASPATRTE